MKKTISIISGTLNRKDNDLSNSAYLFGYIHKSLRDIKVFVKNTEKIRKYRKKDLKIFQSNLKKDQKKKLPRGTEYLKELS